MTTTTDTITLDGSAMPAVDDNTLDLVHPTCPTAARYTETDDGYAGPGCGHVSIFFGDRFTVTATEDGWVVDLGGATATFPGDVLRIEWMGDRAAYREAKGYASQVEVRWPTDPTGVDCWEAYEGVDA